MAPHAPLTLSSTLYPAHVSRSHGLRVSSRWSSFGRLTVAFKASRRHVRCVATHPQRGAFMTTTYLKRSKEKMRQEKQREKQLARQQRKIARDNAPPREPGVDPDIAWIIPGPQPIDLT